MNAILKFYAQAAMLITFCSGSSVAKEAGSRAKAPPIGLSSKMQNKKSNTFLTLLRRSFTLE